MLQQIKFETINYGKYEKLRRMFLSSKFEIDAVKEFDLQNQNVSELPPAKCLDLAKNLIIIVLNNNNINKFDASIITKSCPQIEQFSINNNKIEDLTDLIDLGSLNNLWFLDFSENPVCEYLNRENQVKKLLFPDQFKKYDPVKVMKATYELEIRKNPGLSGKDKEEFLENEQIAYSLQAEVDVGKYAKLVSKYNHSHTLAKYASYPCPVPRKSRFKNLLVLNNEIITKYDIVFAIGSMDINSVIENTKKDQLEKFQVDQQPQRFAEKSTHEEYIKRYKKKINRKYKSDLYKTEDKETHNLDQGGTDEFKLKKEKKIPAVKYEANIWEPPQDIVNKNAVFKISMEKFKKLDKLHAQEKLEKQKKKENYIKNRREQRKQKIQNKFDKQGLPNPSLSNSVNDSSLESDIELKRVFKTKGTNKIKPHLNLDEEDSLFASSESSQAERIQKDLQSSESSNNSLLEDQEQSIYQSRLNQVKQMATQQFSQRFDEETQNTNQTFQDDKHLNNTNNLIQNNNNNQQIGVKLDKKQIQNQLINEQNFETGKLVLNDKSDLKKKIESILLNKNHQQKVDYTLFEKQGAKDYKFSANEKISLNFGALDRKNVKNNNQNNNNKEIEKKQQSHKKSSMAEVSEMQDSKNNKKTQNQQTNRNQQDSEIKNSQNQNQNQNQQNMQQSQSNQDKKLENNSGLYTSSNSQKQKILQQQKQQLNQNQKMFQSPQPSLMQSNQSSQVFMKGSEISNDKLFQDKNKIFSEHLSNDKTTAYQTGTVTPEKYLFQQQQQQMVNQYQQTIQENTLQSFSQQNSINQEENNNNNNVSQQQNSYYQQQQQQQFLQQQQQYIISEQDQNLDEDQIKSLPIQQFQMDFNGNQRQMYQTQQTQFLKSQDLKSNSVKNKIFLNRPVYTNQNLDRLKSAPKLDYKKIIQPQYNKFPKKEDQQQQQSSSNKKFQSSGTVRNFFDLDPNSIAISKKQKARQKKEQQQDILNNKKNLENQDKRQKIIPKADFNMMDLLPNQKQGFLDKFRVQILYDPQSEDHQDLKRHKLKLEGVENLIQETKQLLKEVSKEEQNHISLRTLRKNKQQMEQNLQKQFQQSSKNFNVQNNKNDSISNNNNNNFNKMKFPSQYSGRVIDYNTMIDYLYSDKDFKVQDSNFPAEKLVYQVTRKHSFPLQQYSTYDLRDIFYKANNFSKQDEPKLKAKDIQDKLNDPNIDIQTKFKLYDQLDVLEEIQLKKNKPSTAHFKRLEKKEIERAENNAHLAYHFQKLKKFIEEDDEKNDLLKKQSEQIMKKNAMSNMFGQDQQTKIKFQDQKEKNLKQQKQGILDKRIFEPKSKLQMEDQRKQIYSQFYKYQSQPVSPRSANLENQILSNNSKVFQKFQRKQTKNQTSKYTKSVSNIMNSVNKNGSKNLNEKKIISEENQEEEQEEDDILTKQEKLKQFWMEKDQQSKYNQKNMAYTFESVTNKINKGEKVDWVKVYYPSFEEMLENNLRKIQDRFQKDNQNGFMSIEQQMMKYASEFKQKIKQREKLKNNIDKYIKEGGNKLKEFFEWEEINADQRADQDYCFSQYVKNIRQQQMLQNQQQKYKKQQQQQ